MPPNPFDVASGNDPFALAGNNGVSLMGGDDLIGAAIKAHAQAGRPLNAPMIHDLMERAGAQPKSRHKVYRQSLPLSTGAAVAATSPFTLTVQPQRPFIIERFIVGMAIAAYFTLSDLRVGADSMFVQTGVVPADGFQATAVDSMIKATPAFPGTTISVTGNNIDSSGHQFLALANGPSIMNWQPYE